jgi:hypothetical protein
MSMTPRAPYTDLSKLDLILEYRRYAHLNGLIDLYQSLFDNRLSIVENKWYMELLGYLIVRSVPQDTVKFLKLIDDIASNDKFYIFRQSGEKEKLVSFLDELRELAN